MGENIGGCESVTAPQFHIFSTSCAGGETLVLEFKGEEKAPLNDREMVEAVVCLANRPDGDTARLVN